MIKNGLSVDIVEIDEYQKELGDEFVDSILSENN